MKKKQKPSRASRRAAPLCSHVEEPDAYIDERGNIVIVGHDAWQRVSYVDYNRAIPSAWIPLRRDHANNSSSLGATAP